MSKRYLKHVMVLALALAVTTPAWATNGTNLIGVGPTARGMGGVGVAAPQDAISAIFANPAGMCFGVYCPGSEVVFGGTIFAPTVKSTVKNPFLGTFSAESEMKPFIVPAVGIAAPLSPKVRFGIGAYGVSGMGVDYKNKPAAYGNLYTKLEVMKFAPNFAYQVSDNFSVGASISVDYQNLDLGEGSAHDYAYGAQLGLIYKIGMFSLGASYTTPQSVTHKNVTTFASGNAAANPNYGGVQQYFDLKLESPPIYAGGIAFQPSDKLLVEFDIKYLPWADSTGYQDFDWENQWVYAIGAQYKMTSAIALRAGFNYAKNPVKEHGGFNAGSNVNVQGALVPAPLYEQFRIIGFPAVVEQHMTLGIGYSLTDNVIIDLSLMHAFKQSISETDSSGTIGFESSLEETSTTFGLTYRF